MVTKLIVFCLALCIGTFSAVVSKPRPLVVWHGLGDSHSSPGMLQFASLVKEMHPGIFVHLVYAEKDNDADRRAGFYGNVNDQVEAVSEQLGSIPELEGGFDAIGFSQGGQFLRAYVERFNDPPVYNLITFGSQHMGISDIPACRTYDLLCKLARNAVKSGVYSKWAQQNLIQAQYYRDPRNLDAYLEENHFLTSINNEVYPVEARNTTYAHNLASLQNLVLVIFTQDKTVIPKESAWFGSEAEPEDDTGPAQALQTRLGITDADGTRIIPLWQQPLYIEDWIGIRALDERGGVVLESCEGEHMQLGVCWRPLVKKFVGSRG